jgi:hypothetical protein
MMAEFVNVPVPPDRVQEVYGLLARGAEEAAVNGARGWSRDNLLRAYRESPEAMHKAFDYLAGHAGQEVSTEELAAAIGVTRSQLAGVVGAFGRRKKNRYGEDDLPFRAVWSAGAGMKVYEMSPAVAAVINEARGR